MPIGRSPLAQIQSIAALNMRTHPWEAGYGGMLGLPWIPTLPANQAYLPPAGKLAFGPTEGYGTDLASRNQGAVATASSAASSARASG